jgi:hypothetical protein
VNSRVLAMGALLGMAVMAFCLFQLASASRIAPLEANDISMRKPASRPATAIVLLLTVFGFAGLLEAELVCSGRWNPPGVPAVNLIIMLIGAIAAWTWPMRATLKGGSKFLLWRLAEEEFYVPSIIEVAVLMPLRGLAQLSRFFEWIVIVQLVRGIPSRVLAETGEVAALADEDTNDSKAAAQTLLAVIVMIVGLVLLGR